MEPTKRSSEVSRRRFLRGMFSAGLGWMAAGAVSAQEQAHNPQSAAPDPTQNQSGSRTKNGKLAATPISEGGPMGAHIHLNQVGYLPTEAKRAIVAVSAPLPDNTFCLLDDDVTPAVRFRGTLSRIPQPSGGDSSRLYLHADFTHFHQPGRYRLRLADGRLSAPFTIGKEVYGRLLPLMSHYFDVQCCGEPHTPQRLRCHADDGIAVGGPRNGQHVEASGGWHDAGDYMKFVETTSYVTALMLFAYDHFRRAFQMTTPDGHLPLLLDQARVGLDWLLKMHPTPDEFYYQVGDASDHETWRLPEADCVAVNKAWKPRSVFFGVGANLAGRTAAALAMASRLYRRYDRPFAQRCLAAAQSAYRLGLQNPQVLTTNPEDFYPEKTWEDDMEWGAAALYRTTGEEDYLQQACQFAQAAGPANDVTSVYDSHALAHYTLYQFAPDSLQKDLLDYLQTDADLVRHQASSPYGLGASYSWGTTEVAAGAALSCLLYAQLSGQQEYTDVARWQRDFILGCNPFGLCCLIGAGSRYALFPHHQIADLSKVELTGALIGGPADLHSVQSEKIALDQLEFSVPVSEQAGFDSRNVGVYQDRTQNYVTNEPANDYTSKFLLLTAFYAVSA